MKCNTVKKQAKTTLNHLHSWGRIHSEIRARRDHMVMEGRLKQQKLENRYKLEARLHDLEVKLIRAYSKPDSILCCNLHFASLDFRHFILLFINISASWMKQAYIYLYMKVTFDLFMVLASLSCTRCDALFPNPLWSLLQLDFMHWLFIINSTSS